MGQVVFYRTANVDGLSIFYREAGPRDAPALLLLHGLPSSSRMFEPLFARLSDRHHLVAPDYPGFGHSDWPDAKQFAYTFDRIAAIMLKFTEAIGLTHYHLYMQDYGGPVGFRMALAHPERVQSLIVQNAVAHDGGLGVNWRLGEPTGQIEPPMRVPCEVTCCRWRRLEPGTLAMTRQSIDTIQTCGPMSLRSSINPVRPTYRAIYFTTIAATWRRIRSGRPG